MDETKQKKEFFALGSLYFKQMKFIFRDLFVFFFFLLSLNFKNKKANIFENILKLDFDGFDFFFLNIELEIYLFFNALNKIDQLY